MKHKKIIQTLSLEQKVELITGHSYWYTKEFKELGIPSIRMSDGPYGLRITSFMQEEAKKSTCFPPLCTLGNTFNEELAYNMGLALGEECLENKIDIILGPGINIKRNPLCGRNFEYISEDPYLSGTLASNYIKGVQQKGVGTSLKHFACNSEEENRCISSSNVDLRALREIYLKGFEIAVKNSSPTTIMASYNFINGIQACENSFTLTSILKKEWNYQGLIMSDWGAIYSLTDCINAGLDLEMPGDCKEHKEDFIKDYKEDKVVKEKLDEACDNVIDLALKLSKNRIDNYKFDRESHFKLAEEIALEGSVLLKNKDNILPLNKNDDICLIGDLCEKMRFEGLGSSQVNPNHRSLPLEEIRKINNYPYSQGYTLDGTKDKNLINDAINLASKHEKIVLFVGLTTIIESEGFNRKDLNLPSNQIDLINELIKLNKKIIVVLFNGSPVNLNFIGSIDAILDVYLPGQEGGSAIKKLLFGEANPCGKLNESWPLRIEDTPSYNFYNKNRYEEFYAESIFVGYRYYLTSRIETLFDFGYGLSYTSFKYSALNIQGNKVSFKIKNVGPYKGKEIVQLYVSRLNKPSLISPKEELKNFKKIELDVNQEKEIQFELKDDDFTYFSINENRFIKVEGEYSIRIGASSSDIRLEKVINIKGEKERDDYSSYPSYMNIQSNNFSLEEFKKILPKDIPYYSKEVNCTWRSDFTDLRYSFLGRMILKIALGIFNKQIKKASKLPKDSYERDDRIANAYMMQICAQKECFNNAHSVNFGYNKRFLQGLMDIGNHHAFKGIYKIITSKRK